MTSLSRRAWLRVGVPLLLLAAVVFWLRDPPFVRLAETGFRPWGIDERGTRFRWTSGRASFFVPSTVTMIELPLRAAEFQPGFLPVTVDIAVDGRPADQLRLPHTEWVNRRLRLDTRRTSRRYRRIDLRVSRVWSERYLGVRVGEVRVAGETPASGE